MVSPTRGPVPRAGAAGGGVVATAALVCAIATALFPGGRAEQEQEIAMVEQGEDAAVA